MQNKNAILSIIYNLHISEVKVFVLSALKHTQSNTEIVLFYKNCAPKTLDWLRQKNVTLIPFQDIFPFHSISKTKHSWYLQLEKQAAFRYTYPMLLRNVLFLDFLTANSDKFQNVITADVKDVVFQRNPFEKDFNNCQCFLENRKEKLGTEAINSDWISKTFDTDIISKLASQRISCAGVIAGSTQSMINYYSAFCNQLETSVQNKSTQLFDQAIHNYVVHLEKPADLDIIEDEAGLVSTMSYFKEVDPKSMDFLAYKSAGKIVPIVHQYDRVKGWQKAINHEYDNMEFYKTRAYKRTKNVYYKIRKVLGV